MKRPAVFPDLDPEKVEAARTARTTTEAWQAYGEALLEGNEPCMEMSESAEEIVSFLGDGTDGLDTRRLDSGAYVISDGTAALTLSETEDGAISLLFRDGAEGTDVTDFGPSDVALFIRTLFSAYRKVAAGHLS